MVNWLSQEVVSRRQLSFRLRFGFMRLTEMQIALFGLAYDESAKHKFDFT